MQQSKQSHALLAVETVLESIEEGSETETITLRSGRRVELAAGDVADRIVVRSASGRVLLRVAVTDNGPLLAFESAEIELSARNKLSLSAPSVAINADDLETTVRNNRHAHIAGEDRLEAGAVAIQANEGSVGVRAMDRVALDADHIGLNDMPCPTPFAWSDIAEEVTS